ncbi:MAG TPA: aminotransferase class III-fold pyridoxal phosphate-dependent enzyme [Vicinamibacterales bacterium]|nr:aminotransferase class III-fold pyridoxal phosphate-dependent enzyme [Vicinamibacterales bacterium]
MDASAQTPSRVDEHLERVDDLNRRYRAGDIHAHVPDALRDSERTLDEVAAEVFPASHAALDAASRGLFFSLPVAFDPSESVGPYLAVADRDPAGRPYRFLDMGALIATQAFGENDPAIVQAIVESLPFVTTRYAHSEYQTVLSLRFKAALNRVAPAGTPRHFVCNTGAESVENAIKSVLMNRVMTSDNADGGFVVSFEGAFHGRTLGSLAVTHRKKARLGFPTFDWPHISFPLDDPGAPKATLQREERSLKQLWDLLVSGRLPRADKSKDTYRREIDAIDELLAQSNGDAAAFVQAQRANLSPDVIKRSQRVAAVLIEPIQGEGGVRPVSARFMRKLRLLTRIYDVPLVFDEVQTGWGMTGRLWAHERFDLPFPPDVVTWAKKAQNGILFVSEELATFFQEEKKFNTTWEGDSVGMLRLLALLDKLDLTQVCRTGDAARRGLDALARDYKQILKHVRGSGVMLGFDVVRADWRDALLDRAFRRGLVLLAAGERCVRFYPRYDITQAALDEALAILRDAVGDLVGGGVAAEAPTPKIRVGTLAIPLDTVEAIDLTPALFETLKTQIAAIEQERYGAAAQYPADVLRAGRRPLMQFPLETLESTMANPKAIGVALRDRVSGRLVAYALGSALENHDEEGVASDPHFGENDTFYLHASATLPSVQNDVELQNHLLELLRTRAIAAGFGFLSTLIEESVRETGPQWLRDAPVLERMENYLGSGNTFVYLQATLTPDADRGAGG